MKKDLFKAGWLVAAVLVAVPAAGRAETPLISETKVEIGPRATYIRPKNADQGKWFGGAQLRLHMGEALALEGSIDYYRQVYAQDTKTKVYPVQASLLGYLIPRSPVSPYLLAGAGWYFTKVEGPGGFHNTQDRFGPHAGGGLEAKLTSNLSIDGSYRYLWIESFNTRDNNLLDRKYNDRGYMVTIGLNLNF